MRPLPKPKPNKAQLDRLNTVLSNIGLGSLLFLALGLNGIDNYLHWLSFSLSMAAAGLVLAVIVYGVICWFVPGADTYKSDTGNRVFVLLFFISIMLCFGGGAVINKTWITSKECRTFSIQSFGESGGRDKAFFVFIDGPDGKERLSFTKEFNAGHKVSDLVELSVVTGCLGFRFYKVKCDKEPLKAG